MEIVTWGSVGWRPWQSMSGYGECDDTTGMMRAARGKGESDNEEVMKVTG